MPTVATHRAATTSTPAQASIPHHLAVRIWIIRSALGTSPADMAQARSISTLTAAFNAAAWSRWLTELAASDLLAKAPFERLRDSDALWSLNPPKGVEGGISSDPYHVVLRVFDVLVYRPMYIDDWPAQKTRWSSLKKIRNAHTCPRPTLARNGAIRRHNGFEVPVGTKRLSKA